MPSEISTTGGHYLALDMPAAPYPLGGEARDVVEDVKRLGGFGIAAHPNSPKPALGWRQWDAPFDGIEWLNPDTSWRVKLRQPGWRVGWNVLHDAGGVSVSIARNDHAAARRNGPRRRSLGIVRPQATRRAARRRRCARQPAIDQRGSRRQRLRPSDPRLRDLVPRDVGPRPAGPPAHRRGDARCHHRHAGDPPRACVYRHRRPRHTAGLSIHGDQCARRRRRGRCAGVRRRCHAAHPQQRAVVVRDQAVAGRRTDRRGPRRSGHLTRTAPEGPAIYRAEIITGTDQGSIPWIISNPIYVGVTFPSAAPIGNAPTESRPLFDGQITKWWRTEADPKSTVALGATPGGELRMQYALSAVSPPGRYAAVGVELAGTRRALRSGDLHRPRRQADESLRALPQSGAANGALAAIGLRRRDASRSHHQIRRCDAGGRARAPHPDPRDIHDILFVVETTNSRPGSAGQLWMRDVLLQR